MIPRFASWVTAFADAKSLSFPVKETRDVFRPARLRAADLWIVEEILERYCRRLACCLCDQGVAANKPQINSSKIEMILIQFTYLVEVLVSRLRD
jgi:hypothetical protein